MWETTWERCPTPALFWQMWDPSTLPHAQKNIDRQLIEPFIWQRLLGDLRASEHMVVERRRSVSRVPVGRRHFLRTRLDLLQDRTDLLVGIPLLRFFLQDEVCAHASAGGPFY